VSNVADIYREAARRIAEPPVRREIYSCDSIWFSGVRAGMRCQQVDDCREAYAELFKPPAETAPVFWLNHAIPKRAARDKWRVTALCFMAAISEDHEPPTVGDTKYPEKP
jgi:hypothetical protein